MLDLHKEELPKVRRSLEEFGAFGQALALARAPTGILGRPGDREVVGNKKLWRKWRKGKQEWGKRKSYEAASNIKISCPPPPNPKINVLHVPALSFVSLL